MLWSSSYRGYLHELWSKACGFERIEGAIVLFIQDSAEIAPKVGPIMQLYRIGGEGKKLKVSQFR